MGTIWVVGSINMDVVAQVVEHPVPGQTILGSHLQYIPGGKGSNQAVAAKRAQGNVQFVAKLGHDGFGQTLAQFLETEGLMSPSIAFHPTEATGIALIVVSEQGENTIVVIPGANGYVSPADVMALDLRPDDFVVAQLEIPQATILSAFQRAKAHGATTLLNPAPANPCPPELFPLVDYLILNETELAFYAQQSVNEGNRVDVLRHIKANATQTLIVTLGAKGVLCLDADGTVIHVDGRAVQAVDTTGAGDCFVGTLATALSEGQALDKALQFANTAASLSVQKMGASASLPTRAEIQQALL